MFGKGIDIKKALRSELSGNGDISFSGISTDSRTIEKGEIFLALKGPRFDGHNFIKDLKGKAKGFIVEKGFEFKGGKDYFVVHVEDTLEAYGKLANYWRKKLNPKVIGVTGSLGKTTTKELISAILSKKGKVLKTHSNLNNVIGVSKTLLSLKDEQIAVIEMGVNNIGEMEKLCKISEPDLGVITNIAPVHLEGLRSLKTVYEEKKVLFDYSKEAIFINKEDEFLKGYDREDVKKIYFGKGSSVSYGKPEIVDFKEMEVMINISGEKVLTSFPYINLGLPIIIALASAVGHYFGVEPKDIKEAVKNIKLPKLRMELVEMEGKKIILDAYNANPVSMKYAILTLLQLEGKRKSVVLGDIRELGRYSKYYHSLLGRFLSKLSLKDIVLVGTEINHTHLYLKKKGIRHYYFKEVTEARERFEKVMKESDIVLIKGSRGVALEKILGDPVYVV